MRRLKSLLVVVTAASIAQSAFADDPPALVALRTACAADAQKLCAGVPSGGGRIVACLSEHKDSLSDSCRQAARNAASALPAAGTSASGVAASSAPTASPGASGPGAGAAAPNAATVKGAPSVSFLRMKQAQVVSNIDGPAPGSKDTGSWPRTVPVLDMLIPSTWDVQSFVHFNAEEGCIADLISVGWEAKSADESVAFQGFPDRTWQYADDPAVLRNLTDPGRRQVNGQLKPCPVKKPIKGEDYVRQSVLTDFPAGSTLVSVEPFPDLDQIARKQLGLPADDAGKGVGYRTEALRARIEFQKDGKAMEDWVALVILTRVFRQGRGNFYDCHAVNFMALRAPKGSLDANDKLFKVMISSLRVEPQWKAYSNDWLVWRYGVEAKKQATIDAIWAKFQNQVAQTLSEETANQQRGSLIAAAGADRLARGVQNFLDPTTGRTMELSNQYDHAWLNGQNEYIMSDDPNFNPNGALSGSWNQLQVAQPAP